MIALKLNITLIINNWVDFRYVGRACISNRSWTNFFSNKTQTSGLEHEMLSLAWSERVERKTRQWSLVQVSWKRLQVPAESGQVDAIRQEGPQRRLRFHRQLRPTHQSGQVLEGLNQYDKQKKPSKSSPDFELNWEITKIQPNSTQITFIGPW